MIDHLNEYNIIGILTEDPHGVGEKNNPVRLRVRTTTSYTKKDGSAGERQATHDVTAWDGHAEEGMKLRKDDLVEIRGEHRNVRVAAGKDADESSNESPDADDEAPAAAQENAADPEKKEEWRGRLVVDAGGTLRRI